MLYISVDVEASGHVPGLYNLVSIGATPVVEKDGRYTIGENFYVELRPEFDGFSEEAMAVHGIPREHLEEHGTPASEAMAAFRDWIEDLREPGDVRPIFVGHNAAFDWGYIQYYFHYAGVPSPFNIFPMDIKALSAAVLAIPWARARKSHLKTALAIGEIDEGLRHRADYDAEYQAAMFTAVMEKIYQGRSTAPLPEEITKED